MGKKEYDDFYAGLLGQDKLAEAPVTEGLAAAPEAPSVKTVTTKNLFSNPETHPVVLDFALLKQFKLDWFSWLPETLFSEIEHVFKTSIAEVNRLKILAAQNLHMADYFWEEWEIFEKTMVALNGIAPRLDSMQPLSIESLLAGVDIANLIRKEEFSDEVARYVAGCMLFEQVTYAPPPIEFCQKFISQPYYICKDCEKKGSALPPFGGYCDSCSHRFDQEHPFSLKPEDGFEGAGKNLSIHLTYDPAPVEARFHALNKMSAKDLPGAIRETSEDTESAKLIIAVDYQNFRTKQLQDQLVSLGSWLGESV